MSRWLAAMLVLPLLAGAAIADAADTASLESDVTRIAEELRCLVCQNQSIAESNAELAADLKNQIREQLRAGRSDREIKDYMVQRYGDFVLYRPPLRPSTWILWFAPFLLMVIALAGLTIVLWRRAREAAPPISAEQHARAVTLLEGREPDEPA